MGQIRQLCELGNCHRSHSGSHGNKEITQREAHSEKRCEHAILRTHYISEGREVERFDRKMGREAGKSGFMEAQVRSLKEMADRVTL